MNRDSMRIPRRLPRGGFNSGSGPPSPAPDDIPLELTAPAPPRSMAGRRARSAAYHPSNDWTADKETDVNSMNRTLATVAVVFILIVAGVATYVMVSRWQRSG